MFAEVAQQVLEYLGVPHDIEIKPPKEAAKLPRSRCMKTMRTTAPDINALFAAVNDLPADDPLREPAPQPLRPPPELAGANANRYALPQIKLPCLPEATCRRAAVQPAPQKAVVLTADGERKVPELIGLPVRKVIETAAMAGLEVEVTGSGTVREQAPAAGSIVGPGTRIVVRCSR